MLRLRMPTALRILATATLLTALLIYTNIKLEADAKRKSTEIKNSYGVNIHYNYVHASFFPRHPTARGSQAWFVASILSNVEKFLSKYPKEVISRNLSDLFLVGILEFSGKRYGGTYIDSAIYISTGGFLRNHDSSLLALMHAEFSSILLHNYKDNFPFKEWEAVNKPTSRYTGSGFEMLGNAGLYDQTEELLDNGFLEGYSQAQLEEDFNIFVDWIFTKPNLLKKLASKYHRIEKKYQLVIKFYKSIDPRIDIPVFDTEALGN
jgi:hypothetical protein